MSLEQAREHQRETVLAIRKLIDALPNLTSPLRLRELLECMVMVTAKLDELATNPPTVAALAMLQDLDVAELVDAARGVAHGDEARSVSDRFARLCKALEPFEAKR